MKKRLDVQKDEYEEAIKRHLSFIDQVTILVLPFKLRPILIDANYFLAHFKQKLRRQATGIAITSCLLLLAYCKVL